MSACQGSRCALTCFGRIRKLLGIEGGPWVGEKWEGWHMGGAGIVYLRCAMGWVSSGLPRWQYIL